jgi:U6 snRNA-associated Sm-like protein LSm2
MEINKLNSLFYSLLKELSDKHSEITIELKNDLEITGKLTTVDSKSNLVLSNVKVSDESKFPQLVSK